MKIGFISLPLSGHLNPMTALARRLQSRGHEVVFFGIPDVGPTIQASNLTFVPFGEKEHPLGFLAEVLTPLGKLQGLAVAEYHLQKITAPLAQTAFEQLPQKLVETGIEAMVIDTQHRFLELVPIGLNMPYAHVWLVLPLDGSGTTPPMFFHWPHETTPQASARNIEGLKKVSGFVAPVVATAKSYAEKKGLQIDWNTPSSTLSRLAVIAQTPREFDFPDIPWPTQFHYAGPFHDDYGRESTPFPWERLTDKPLIYASLGTVVNGLSDIYKAILQAVGRSPYVQVVLSVGKNINTNELGPIPSNTIVVPSAPQIELLKRAALCITHAGLNTALESLAQGVPMVAIPIAYDQPGVAARIAYHGVGELIRVEDVTAEHIAMLISMVLNGRSYRDKARHFQRVIAKTDGLNKAAALLEQAFQKFQVENPSSRTNILSLA